MAVLGHHVTHVAELGLLALAFAEQARIGIGGRSMRLVRAFLAMEVALSVAPAARALASRRRRLAAVIGHEALHAGPGLDQRAVDREAVARQQLANLRLVEDAAHELAGYIAVEQPIPVLAKDRGVPHRTSAE